MKRITVLLLILVVAGMFCTLSAQCPMCKIAAESNLENGGTAGQGLNTGILYMLLMPYLLIGVLGFVWYKNRRKDSDIGVNDQFDVTQN